MPGRLKRAAMKTSIDHLPEAKQQELQRIVATILDACDAVEIVILYGSHARGDWKDGPHEQGKGRLVIHKQSDYDILVITLDEYSARDTSLWQDVKETCKKAGLSTYLSLIARDSFFVNQKLREGQYFFTEVIEQGVVLYDSGRVTLEERKELDLQEQKRIVQSIYNDVLVSAKEFYDAYEYLFNKESYKVAAFQLNQACEHTYKAVLLIFGGESPHEHHLDTLEDRAIDYLPAIKGLFPCETKEEQDLFELLDYAYIGARYDYSYAITKEQLKRLALCVKQLQDVVDAACQEKIRNFS